ncbi:MAG: ABC transporter permease [Acidimicrobiia bacterium]|nr:ABC transporter permease [Acidimicrobiia bacterium]
MPVRLRSEIGVPEIRFEKRLKPPRWLGPATPPIAVIVALAIGALVLWASGRDAVDIYQRMARSAFTNPGAFSNTLIAATPLLLTGLAAAVTFRMKVWNIGADGQLMIGAVLAAAAGTFFGGRSLAAVMALMILAGIVGGCLWASIAALLRVYLNTNEVLTTLMLNYIAPLILFYLIFNSTSYWRDLSTQSARVFPQAKTLAEDAFWPTYGAAAAVPFGFLLGVVLALALYFVVRNTRFGFQMRVSADSPEAARYAGISTGRLLILVMLLSGALAGIAGASQIGDVSHRLEPKNLQLATFGYTGIAVAALVRYHPIGIVVSAILVGALNNAGLNQQGPDLPLGLIGVNQGIIQMQVAASEVTARYRLVIGRRARRGDRAPPPEQATLEPGASPEQGTSDGTDERPRQDARPGEDS